jgi:hypothetical protein
MLNLPQPPNPRVSSAIFFAVVYNNFFLGLIRRKPV